MNNPMGILDLIVHLQLTLQTAGNCARINLKYSIQVRKLLVLRNQHKLALFPISVSVNKHCLDFEYP